MAGSIRRIPGIRVEVAGLDALEAAEVARRPWYRRAWSATWPKLLAFVVAICFVYSFLNDQGWNVFFFFFFFCSDKSTQSLSLEKLLKASNTDTNAPPAGK